MPHQPVPGAPELLAALDHYRTSLADAPVRSLLLEHNRRRGSHLDLQLATFFAEEAAGRAEREPAPWWDLCRGLADLPARRAPAGDPAEFVAFCGSLGVAAVACVVGEHVDAGIELVRYGASDPRWRLREAAAMGLQRLLLARRKATLAALRSFVADGRPLEMRAVAAAMAQPSVLAVAELAQAAGELHRLVLDQLLAAQPRGGDWLILRQALGYSLGMVATARPRQGFALLRELVESGGPDGNWIARENLRQVGLRQRFPQHVAELEQALAATRQL